MATTYTIAGATLDPGVDFTSHSQRIDTAAESAHFHAAIGSFADVEIQHRYVDLDGYDDVLLARWGIVRTVVADPLPPVVRPELPKSTVVSRLNTIGKLAAVFAVIQSSPLLFGLWFAPDWPNVYCDDADVLSAFSAAGLTADEVSQVMAPP